MGTESGTISAGLAGSEVGEKLLREPFAFDFFQAVRLLERLLPERTSVGQFAHPETEVARFGAAPVACVSGQPDPVHGLSRRGSRQR